MELNHVLGMVCGYYLSRFDAAAYQRLGYPTQKATHEALGKILGVQAASIKNWRDEFDPIHNNGRRGWCGREMFPSRRRTADAFCELTEPELFNLVRRILRDPAGELATNLVSALDASDVGMDARKRIARLARVQS